MPPPPAPGAIGCILCAILVALFTPAQGKPFQVKPGCRYEGRRYQEGALVTTSEPCLQCCCSEATLRCRLRVCPRIPNPPPPECHLLVPTEHACCSEMICGESKYEGKNSLRRMDTMEMDDVTEEDGCLFGGVRYGPGSAMIATRRCEYCYCILGARRCVRPKCLLPLPGCVPLYVPHSCCPVAYNCTRDDQDEGTSTTTQSMSSNGCRVGNRVYNEGEMVRDIAWKAACDNCFCAMGDVRCVPLACAPPLQGCSPVVREGQCCPSTYNCSGTIEVKAMQNYASYAFVSKDYANFRKETHFYPVENQVSAILSNAIVEGRGHRIIDEETYTTDREIIDVTTLGLGLPTEDSTSGDSAATPTLETSTLGNEILSDTTTESVSETSTSLTTPSSTEVIITTANFDISTTTTPPPPPQDVSTYESTDFRNAISTTPEERTNSEEAETTTNESLTTPSTLENDSLKERFENSKSNDESIGRSTERPVRDTTASSNSSSATTSESIHEEDRSKINNSAEQTLISSTREPGTTASPTTVRMPDDFFAMNVTVRTNVSIGHVQGVTITPPVRSIPPDVEAILNITQREKGEDYDYYSEPTLPPSLPNVRIIPFVAADALVKNEKDTTSSVTAYPSGSAGIMPELQRPTDSTNFYDIVTRENRFSPPVETEGGFVPRDPPYFEAPYHSTDLSLEIGTGVTVVPADITNPNRKEDGLMTDCRFETRQYRHGEFIPNSGMCVICMCYYGQIICSDEKCPPLKIGCRRVNAKNGCCWKIICVDAAESPTMVLDRADATAPSQRQPVTSLDGLATPDPFRDVIKTEPAPDLPSLIEDMLPYLVNHGISTPRPTTPMSNGINSGSPIMQKGDFGAEFFGTIPPKHSGLPPYDYRDQIDRRKDDEELVNGSPISSNDESYSFHDVNPNHRPSFPTFSRPELGGENLADKEGSEFSYAKVISDNAADTVRNSSRQKEQGFGYKDPPGSFANHSKSDPVTTELLPLKSSAVPDNAEDIPDPIGNNEPDNNEEDSIPSFGNVFDLLFLEATTEKPGVRITVERSDTPTTISSISTLIGNNPSFTTDSSASEKSESFESGSTDNPYFQSKVNEKEVLNAVGGLLKLAGCNIYGRMYRVGRIITELSGPCLECRCTEIGVQCKKLSC